MELINCNDLLCLREIAAEDRSNVFRTRSDFAKVYADRLIAVALCQGAACHYVNGTNGVKDFDIWTFYADKPGRPVNARRKVSRDFGRSKFGTHPSDTNYLGRRVDLFMRAIKCDANADPVIAIRDYLTVCKTKSAAYLSEKAVVLLEPLQQLGEVVWPQSL